MAESHNTTTEAEHVNSSAPGEETQLEIEDSVVQSDSSNKEPRANALVNHLRDLEEARQISNTLFKKIEDIVHPFIHLGWDIVWSLKSWNYSSAQSRRAIMTSAQLHERNIMELESWVVQSAIVHLEQDNQQIGELAILRATAVQASTQLEGLERENQVCIARLRQVRTEYETERPQIRIRKKISSIIQEYHESIVRQAKKIMMAGSQSNSS